MEATLYRVIGTGYIGRRSQVGSAHSISECVFIRAYVSAILDVGASNRVVAHEWW